MDEKKQMTQKHMMWMLSLLLGTKKGLFFELWLINLNPDLCWGCVRLLVLSRSTVWCTTWPLLLWFRWKVLDRVIGSRWLLQWSSKCRWLYVFHIYRFVNIFQSITSVDTSLFQQVLFFVNFYLDVKINLVCTLLEQFCTICFSVEIMCHYGMW